MTNDTPALIMAASRCVRAAWRPDYRLVKCGVMLDDLCATGDAPRSLFETSSPRAAAGMVAMDALNARFGRGTVFIAAAEVTRGWKLRAEHHSPCHTTRLADVPIARA